MLYKHFSTAQGDSSSPQDLCERHEKGVLHEHQRALHKYSMMKRQMMSATVQPKEQASVEQLESRIVQVDSQFSRTPAECWRTVSWKMKCWFGVHFTRTLAQVDVQVCLSPTVLRTSYYIISEESVTIKFFFNFGWYPFTFQAQLLLTMLYISQSGAYPWLSFEIFNPTWWKRAILTEAHQDFTPVKCNAESRLIQNQLAAFCNLQPAVINCRWFSSSDSSSP